MALHLDMDRLNQAHIGSCIAQPEDAFIVNPLNRSEMIIDPKYTSTSADLLSILVKGICAYQNEPGRVGCWGYGIDWSVAQDLLPAVMWLLFFICVRYAVRAPLVRIGYYMGIGCKQNPKDPNRPPLYDPVTGKLTLSKKRYQKLVKFQNQVWLTFFYTASAIFGYVVQQDKEWFTFPVNRISALYYHSPSPYNPPSEIMLYYHYGLGFYISELISLLWESNMKRADFVEYFFHHITTLALILLSHLGWLHRFGAYTLFIHDASDIMLSFSKSLHYMVQSDEKRAKIFNEKQKRLKSSERYDPCWCFKYVLTDSFVYSFFVVFIASFFYFRWYCLPSMMWATVWLGPNTFHGNLNVWILVVLLNGALQALHAYWGYLILIMILNLLRGVERKDIRSDEEDTEEEHPEGIDRVLQDSKKNK